MLNHARLDTITTNLFVLNVMKHVQLVLELEMIVVVDVMKDGY